MKNKWYVPLLFVIPALTGLLIFRIGPIFLDRRRRAALNGPTRRYSGAACDRFWYSQTDVRWARILD